MRIHIGAIALGLVATGSAVSAAPQVGSVLRSQRIGEGAGGFRGALVDRGNLGWAVAALDDLDGDGVEDVAVSAPHDGDGGHGRGAIWILFLRENGTVKAQQKISQTSGNFGGQIPDHASFGQRLASLGDLDGDGLTELAVTSGGHDPDGPEPRLWTLFLNADGTVRRHAEIHYGAAVFTPPAIGEDFIDADLAALGDLDGDGLTELAVGAPRDDDGPGRDLGAVWVLFMGADGRPQRTQKISQTQGGFTGTLDEGERFGSLIGRFGDLEGDGTVEVVVGRFLPRRVLSIDSTGRVTRTRDHGSFEYVVFFGSLGWYARGLCGLGDLDGDRIPEIAMGFPAMSVSGPGDPVGEGGIAIGFLRDDGTIRKRLPISHQRGGLGALPSNAYFGWSVVPIGDLDGDGGPELFVGAPLDDGGGPDRGAAHVLFLDPDALRNGGGINPTTLGQVGEPALGRNWKLVLDCGAHAPGVSVVFIHDTPASGTLSRAGEILVSGTRLLRLAMLHHGGTASHPVHVPADVSLADLQLFVQGLCTGSPGPALSNALDVIVGE